jgi:hypothetical protein
MFGKLNNERVGSHTNAEWDAVVIAQGYLCFYCGRPICKDSADPELEIEKDHLLHQSRRGVDFIWNIVAACKHCNQLKGTKLPGEFLRERWAFAHAVDAAAEQSTCIPLTKGRAKWRSYVDDEEDANGVYVKNHLEVTNDAAQIIRYLSAKSAMPADSEQIYWQQRRQQLAKQVETLGRRFLEAAGQLQLPLDMPSSVKKSTEAREAAALVTTRGLHVADQPRRA